MQFGKWGVLGTAFAAFSHSEGSKSSTGCNSKPWAIILGSIHSYLAAPSPFQDAKGNRPANSRKTYIMAIFPAACTWACTVTQKARRQKRKEKHQARPGKATGGQGTKAVQGTTTKFVSLPPSPPPSPPIPSPPRHAPTPKDGLEARARHWCGSSQP